MKTKVIAVRVTEEEYRAIKFRADKHGQTVAWFLNSWLRYQINDSVEDLRKEVKKLEAKAKREAKKAAAQQVTDAPA
jgi:7,8-dihydro-6-hydroxymethylpterin-pyrophosphokinase